MASVFLYGPYASFSSMLPPGGEETWVIGPWSWYADAITVTAHPLALSGADRTMTVRDVTVRAAPNGDRFVRATVRNVGVDAAYYAVWVGGVAP